MPLLNEVICNRSTELSSLFIITPYIFEVLNGEKRFCFILRFYFIIICKLKSFDSLLINA